MFFQAKYYNTKTTFTKLLRKYIITRGLFIYIYIYILFIAVNPSLKVILTSKS